MLYNFYNLFQLEGPIQESNTNARYLKKKKSFILFLDAKILIYFFLQLQFYYKLSPES